MHSKHSGSTDYAQVHLQVRTYVVWADDSSETNKTNEIRENVARVHEFTAACNDKASTVRWPMPAASSWQRYIAKMNQYYATASV